MSYITPEIESQDPGSNYNFKYKAALNNTGPYMVSGIPYVTGNLTVPSGNSASPLVITFPSVTQRIHIHNNDSTYKVRVGFSAIGVSGSGTNYWLVESHATNGKNTDYIELRVKTDKIFLISDDATHNATPVFVAAELTGISDYALTTAYSGSAGIG